MSRDRKISNPPVLGAVPYAKMNKPQVLFNSLQFYLLCRAVSILVLSDQPQGEHIIPAYQ